MRLYQEHRSTQHHPVDLPADQQASPTLTGYLRGKVILSPDHRDLLPLPLAFPLPLPSTATTMGSLHSIIPQLSGGVDVASDYFRSRSPVESRPPITCLSRHLTASSTIVVTCILALFHALDVSLSTPGIVSSNGQQTADTFHSQDADSFTATDFGTSCTSPTAVVSSPHAHQNHEPTTGE
jgi:hypothetical protein